VSHSIPADLRACLPRWTAKVASDFGGRDPLGLSPVAHLFTERLLGGIITTTTRARYYSVYCWILWHIGEMEGPATESEFMDAFQRREAAFAIGTVLDEDGAMSPIGVEAVERKLRENDDQIPLDFQVLPSSKYGGFKANYMGSMYQLGLWHRPTEIREEVTGGIATSLARAVDATVSKTPFATKRLWRRASVDREDMRKSATALSLAAITRKIGARERQLVTELLFGWDEGTASDARVERRETLAWILWAVAEHERLGLVCASNPNRIEYHLLYLPLYCSVLVEEESDRPATCSPPERLGNVARAWLYFAVHGYLTVALEQIMSAVLMLLEDDEEDGIAAPDIVARLMRDGFRARLKQATGKGCSRPRELLVAVGATEPSDASRVAVEPRSITHELSEPCLAGHESESAGEQLANGLLLLAALYRRWRSAPDEPTTSWLRLSVGGELWVGTVLPSLDLWFDAKLSWEDALLAFVERFVIAQHDLVMYGKGRLESCWLHMDGGTLYFDQDLQPQSRASRFPQSVSMLRDLGLLEVAGAQDDSGNALRVTAEGRRVLARVLKDGA
jgi:hypothetical protein